jgi:serine/threonine-protein kinase
VHRDIKPENILLAGDQAIVADFGIARAVQVAGGERLTGTGLAVGTPAYLSPEHAYADPHIDHRADIYAIGAVAYELLTGRPPFMGTTRQEGTVNLSRCRRDFADKDEYGRLPRPPFPA